MKFEILSIFIVFMFVLTILRILLNGKFLIYMTDAIFKLFLLLLLLVFFFYKNRIYCVAKNEHLQIYFSGNLSDRSKHHIC